MKQCILLLAVFMFSLLMNAQSGVQVGDKAPEFRAQDQYGNFISLSEQIKEKPVVVFFYRGQWCPNCTRYLSDLQDSIQMIVESGAFVVAITPEKSEEISKTVDKTNAKYPIIYDKDHQIMDSYDVTFELAGSKHLIYKAAGIDINKASGNDDRALPVPATFIIDKSGIVRVRHFEMDYKDRMTVQEIIKALKTI